LVVSLLSTLATIPAATAAPADDPEFARVGPELRALYQAHLAARESGRPLVVTDPWIRVVEDRVTIDAVAADGVDELKASLVALGMRSAVSAGRIVSGQLPIAQIRAMAGLPGLGFARAARFTTHNGGSKGAR
jgi:hypothetical protein